MEFERHSVSWDDKYDVLCILMSSRFVNYYTTRKKALLIWVCMVINVLDI